MEIKLKEFNMGTYCGIYVRWPDGLDHAIRFKKRIEALEMQEVIEALGKLQEWHDSKNV